MRNIDFYNNKFLYFFISIIIITSIFFWEISFYGFSFRYIIIFLLLINILNFQKNDLKYYLFYLFFVLFFIIHSYLSSQLLINKHLIFSFCFMYLLLCISLKFKDFFVIFLKDILIYYFICINLLALLFLIFFPTEIYNYKTHFNGLCTIFDSNHYKDLLHYFFVENSHFAFVNNAAIITGLFFLNSKHKYYNLLYFVFLINTFLFFMSATLLMGLMVISIITILFLFKYLTKNIIFLFLSLFLLSTLFFIYVPTCKIRLTQMSKVAYIYVDESKIIPSFILNILVSFNNQDNFNNQDKFKTTNEIKIYDKSSDALNVELQNISNKINFLNNYNQSIINDDIKNLGSDISNESKKSLHELKDSQEFSDILQIIKTTSYPDKDIEILNKIDLTKKHINFNEDITSLEDQINFLIDELTKIKIFIKRSTWSRFINYSTAIHANSYLIAWHSIKDKIFGYGFQQYWQAHQKYLKDIELVGDKIPYYNYNDGASNFSKLSAEFGILNIFFGLIFIIFLYNNKIDISVKLFAMSIIITQIIRGAGYFNGSFFLFYFIALSFVLEIIFKHYNKIK